MSAGMFKNSGVILATIFSVVLIIGAYMIARGVESPSVAQASTETALLQAIATKDSDNDGLPDWEEVLYGTDAHIADTFKLGMTDGEAVARGLIVPKAIAEISDTTQSSSGSVTVDPSLPPTPADGTLTATFAQNFFTLYLQAKQAKNGADLSEAEMNAIASQALSALGSSVKPAPDFKSGQDLKVSGSGVDALTSFAVDAEAILLKNTSTATTSELVYLKYAIENDNETALTYISSIAKAYRDSAVGIAKLPVPQELAATDLILVNALMRISQITADFARANSDPLAAILALQQYPQATSALSTAFINIGKIYAKDSISLPAGAPGASFVNIISDMTAEQQAGSKKL